MREEIEKTKQYRKSTKAKVGSLKTSTKWTNL